MEYIISTTGLTVVINGNVYTVYQEDHKYKDAIKCIKEKDEKGLLDLLDELKQVSSYVNNANTDIMVDGYEIKYKGVPVHNYVVDVIFRMKAEGFDIDPLVKFLENLLQNPSNRAIKELYGFLEYGRLPITSDGCFLAYKKVNPAFRDIHSNTIDNSIGTTVTMNRQDVDDNCNNTCSTGLHFCSLNYLGSFGSSGDPVVILKIDPKDVVSIPVDYNNTKGRCCKYEVVGLYTQPLTASVETAYSDDINDEYEEELDPQVEADWEEYDEVDVMSYEVDRYDKVLDILKDIMSKTGQDSIKPDNYDICCKTRQISREVKNRLFNELGITVTTRRDPAITHPWIVQL